MTDEQSSVYERGSFDEHLYNGLLLQPPKSTYDPFLSELSSLAYKDWRDHMMTRAVQDLRQDCSYVSWHLLDQGITAGCPVGDEQEVFLMLNNAFSCVAEGLDIVSVKGQLYCLDIPKNQGISIAKVMNDEVPVGIEVHQEIFENLLYLSELPDDHIEVVLRTLRQYMASVGKSHYIENVEGTELKGYVMNQYYVRQYTQLHSLVSAEKLFFMKGVYGEIWKAGGGVDGSLVLFNLAKVLCYIGTPVLLKLSIRYYPKRG